MIYKTSGTCSTQISFDLDEKGCVHHVAYDRGCPGNLQGVSRLVEGMDAREVIAKLEGITCATKPTSCPDQLAKALKEALGE